MKMSAIFDITYEQLFSLDTKSLNEIQASYILRRVRKNVDGYIPESRLSPYLKAVSERLPALLEQLFDDEHFAAVRFLYDTQERFDKAAALMEKSMSMGPMLQTLIVQCLESIMDSEEGADPNLLS
jgi:hypothetical protein